VVSNGQTHIVPPNIVYYNVFNATEAEDVVYLVVKNLTEYKGHSDLNGVSRESQIDFERRMQEDPTSHNAPMEGAYGSINVQASSEVQLEFEFMNWKMEPLIPDKIVAMTFLDLDQPQAAVGNIGEPDTTAGMEEVDICTGTHSFGWPESTQLNHSWVFVDESQNKVCHSFSSRTEGHVEDNPWNPANVRQDGEQGLEEYQKEKIFTAAFWQTSSLTATFKVRANENRNFLYAGHATSFCSGEFACAVKMDKCAEAVDSLDEDFKNLCLERERCEKHESAEEFDEKSALIRESKGQASSKQSKGSR